MLGSHILFRDYETRSKADLRQIGAHRYAAHPSTEVLCCCYALDDGPVQSWQPSNSIPPEFIEAASNPDYVVSAYNDQFERLIETHILAPRLGWPLVPLDRHRCTQAATLALALPAKLSNAAEALGLDQKKDDEGHKLMLKMCKPRPDGTWLDDPESRARLIEYCRQDVETERALYTRVGHLIPAEQLIWQLDQVINDRGVAVDRQFIEGAIKIGRRCFAEINAEIGVLTNGAVETVGQVTRIIDWLGQNGCDVPDLRKATISQAMRRNGLPESCRRVLELRRVGAHSATAKYETMLDWTGEDGRIRGALKYHAASTGRWASYGVQLHNMKREGGAVDIDAIRAGAGTLEQIGESVRHVIVAAPGKTLWSADYSGVESRYTAWLSGEQPKTDMWARFDETGKPEDEPYFIIGIKLGFPADQARKRGKVADLAFGYMGGAGAYRNFAPDDGLTDEQIKALQLGWRDQHPNIVRLWYALDSAAIRAVASPGKHFSANAKISFVYEGDFLFMQLPSGRRLAYPFPRLIDDKFNNKRVVFKDTAFGKFADCRNGTGAYGGIWIENAVQAVARDILADTMLKLESSGYPIVLHIHDQITCEVDHGSVH